MDVFEAEMVRRFVVAVEKIANALDRKTENCSEKPNNCEPKICDTCRYYNSNIPCGSTPSACKEADKFAEEFVKGLKKNLKPQIDKDINVRSKDEPYIDIETGILHWCGWKYRRIYDDEPQTERSE